MAGPSLQLEYQFKSTPDLILASAAGSNPNTVDPEVMISNRSLSGTAMREIIIQIPTGEESRLAISMARDLPDPCYDTAIPWTISSSGSVVTIQPKAGASGTLTGPIIFTLPGIQVNQTPGTVPITITEYNAPAPERVDDSTYSLYKQLRVTPDGSRTLVANRSGAGVTIVDIPNRTSARVALGNRAGGVGIAPDGSLALISLRDADGVAVM
jgi:hypothetical protein